MTIKGPKAIIGYDCELRQSAYLGSHALIGDGVVIGNSTEVKTQYYLIKHRFPISIILGIRFLDMALILGQE